MLTGPFTCYDYTATPTTTTDGQGNTITTYPALAGVFYITDPATFSRSTAQLSAYAVTQIPAQHVLGGDDPANPGSTITLKFPDQATAQPIVDAVNALPPIPSTPAAEVPMYKVKIVMEQTASSHGGTLYDRVPLFIASLPAPQQVVANQLWAGAPNLVVSGDFASQFRAWEGLSGAQWNALISQAQGLAL